jgi:transposase-like protein
LIQQDLFQLEDYDLGVSEGKTCSKCNQFLPLSKFSWHSGGNYLRPECKSCNNELSKVRNALREKYGMPQEGYVCPICLNDDKTVAGKGNTRNGAWVIDHCHNTNTFRGWLCHKCNRSLGGFDDSIEVLQRAIDYIRTHEESLNETNT